MQRQPVGRGHLKKGRSEGITDARIAAGGTQRADSSGAWDEGGLLDSADFVAPEDLGVRRRFRMLRP